MNPYFKFEDLIWQNDFNGEDCGFDNVNVVGFYYHDKLGLLIEVNIETMEILRIGVDTDEFN
jgi:hypothetical protein